MPTNEDVISEQLSFFQAGGAGCAFATRASKNPDKHGWRHRVIAPSYDQLNAELEAAVADEGASMVSIIVPAVNGPGALVAFIAGLDQASGIFLEQDIEFEGFRCLGYRFRFGENVSWISGFGPFDFLPRTRQAPFVELAMRVKERPRYEWYFKEAPEGVVHLADLDMGGLAESTLRKYWSASISSTTKIIGHPANLCSAAKTTYAIPQDLWT